MIFFVGFCSLVKGKKRTQWEWVEKKKNTFTCCKNTFLVGTFHVVAVSTRGDTQQPVFLLDVRCQCWEKTNVQTCAQRLGGVREGGRVYKEQSVGCSEDGGQETESDCWRICVHFNPERKGDQLDSFFICQTTTASTMPPSLARWLCPWPWPCRAPDWW